MPDGRPLPVRTMPGRPGAPDGPMSPPGDPAPLATATLQGTFLFEDRELTEVGFTGVTWMAPIRGADVEYYDADTAQVLGTASTDETGSFWMQVTDTLTRNVAFRAVTTSWYDPRLFNASVTQLPSQGGQAYVLTSAVYPNHDPAVDLSFTGQPVNATRASGLGGPFHIFDLAESAERYVENLTSALPSVNLTVYWSAGVDEGKYYDTFGHVYLPGTSGGDDSYDDNVILHEIGHYITMSYSAEAGYYGAHGLAGTVDIRLAYVEALGSYFMGAIRNFLNVSQPLIYIETDGTNLQWFGFSLSYDTDTPSSYSDGAFVDTTAANEVADAHAIYDIVDGVTSNDGTLGIDDDALDLPWLVGDRLVWDVMISIRENATLFTKTITMETFFDQWLLVNPGYAAQFTQILLDAGIEYAADAFENDDTSPTAAVLLPDGSLGHHTFFPAGDEDWAVFTAIAGEQYVLKTQSLLDGADTVLELYDSDGTTLLQANNDRDASTKASLLTVTAASGQAYYLRVRRLVESPLPIGEYGKYDLTVYVLPNPKPLLVTPNTGPVAGGTGVVISGSNFAAGATVRFGAYDAVGVIALDAFTITATTPVNIPGSADVTVISPPNADGLVPRGILLGGFTYTGSPLPPVVTSITPDFGTSSVPTAVTVKGDYFLPGAALEFDAIPCTGFSWVDARTIAALVQPLPVAVYDVVVRNPDGQWDALENAFESAAYAGESVPTAFDWGTPISRTLAVADDFEIMDLFVYANITHPPMDWGGVRIELTSPAGRTVRVFDRIEVADSTGATWRTRINATFGYDEAPSEVLWQFRGERTFGTWTLNLSTVLDGGVPSTLHGWAVYFFRFRHQDVSRVVVTEALYRNYATGFDVESGKQLYRVRLQAKDPIYFAPYPNAVAVARDQRHACGAGYSDYNNTRGGWTDSTVTCFELLTGRVVRVLYLSGNLAVDGLEAAADADRMVAATNEFVYRINTTTMQIEGNVSTGFPPGAPTPHTGVTNDGRKAYLTREDASFVVIVDLDALAVIGQIDTPGYFPLDVDFTRDGLLGYVSCSEAPPAFVRFDPATDLVLATVPVGALRPVQTVLSPDGTKAFYTHYQWYAGSSRTNFSTFAESGIMPDPESTTLALAIGRDGTLFIADWYLNRIWVYDSATEALLKDLVVPDRPYLTGTEVGDVVGRVALSAFGGDGYVQLDWSAATANGTPVQNYTIYRGDAAGEEMRYASVGPITAFTDPGVVTGQTYYYRVSASNAAGEGPWSNEASGSPNTYFPVIAGVAAAPDPQAVGGTVNLTATVTDVPPLTGVWVNVTDPLAGTTNSSMTRVGLTNVFFFEAPYGLLGLHSFVVSAVNVDGHWSVSGASTFSIITDTTPPEISEVLAAPDPQVVGGAVNITARVIDDTIASTVWANVSLPGGGFSNGTMTRVGASEYFYRNATYGLLGVHTFTVGAGDPAGNTNSSAGHMFLIVDASAPLIANVLDAPDPQVRGGPVNITATITDNVGIVGAWLNVTSPGGGSTNVSLTRAGLTDEYFHEEVYGTFGNHSYNVSAVDASGNWAASGPQTFLIVDLTPPVFVAYQAAPDPQALGGPVNITATITDDAGVAGAWVGITPPGGASTVYAMARVGATDDYFFEQSYAALGVHAYRLIAADEAGIYATVESLAFTIIDATPPQITNVLAAPDPQAVGGPVNITATVTDDVGVSGAWVHVTFPGGGSSNTSLVRVGSTDTYFVEAGYASPGAYSYAIWATDLGGNWGASASYSFAVIDVQPPTISMVAATPNPQDLGGRVNITAVVMDDIGVAGVWANVSGPAGGSANLSMTRVGATDTYFLDRSYGLLGSHLFRLWTSDASGNLATAAGSFLVVDQVAPWIADVRIAPAVQEIHGRVNVSAIITDNVAVFPPVWMELTDPSGGSTNVTLVRDPSDRRSFDAAGDRLGTYAFTIWARDESGNWNSTSSTFEIRDSTAPIAVAGEDVRITVGAEVTFNGSASSDNSGGALNFTWRVSQGSVPVTTLYGRGPTFTFASGGKYAVVLVVRDASGNAAEDSLQVTVEVPATPGGDGGMPLSFWVVLVLVAVTLLIIALLVYRRKRPREEVAGPPEAAPAEERAVTADPAGAHNGGAADPPEADAPDAPVPEDAPR